MDLNIHEPLEPSSIKYKYDDDINNNNHIEPQELLEECWFFRNLLDRKTRILRSFSDPCTSSNFSQENLLPAKSFRQMYESIEKQPSMPPCLERRDEKNPITISTDHPPRNKCNRKTSSNNLCRAPSLPNSFGIQYQCQDEEDNEFSMGKLIRQASMNSSEIKRAAKGVTKSHCSVSRNRSRMKPELKSIKLEGLEETRNQSLIKQFEIQRNSRNIELPEEYLQGFKDLGFNLDKKDGDGDGDGHGPNVITTINEGLQENFKEDEEKNNSSSCSSSSVPNRGGVGEKKSAEDMKEQIKFWAKAVASNVR